MEITIKGTEKEIAALVVEVQKQHGIQDAPIVTLGALNLTRL